MIAPVPATAPAGPAASPAAGPAGGPAAGTPVDPQVAEAARGLEGVFMSMLVEQMMAGALSSANPMHAGLVTERLGEALAEAGGIGLAAVLERQLGGAS